MTSEVAYIQTIGGAMEGTIKRVINDRGFGFITSVEGQEVFFHRTEVKGLHFDELKLGEKVDFDLEQGAKSPRAFNLRPRQA